MYFKGEFVKLSCDKQSSHVVETCWSHVDTSHKELILQELLQDEHKLAKDFFGSKVIKKCNLEQFKRKKCGWIEREEKANKKRQIFDKIIHEEERKKKKTKGMKEEHQGKCAVQSFAAEMAVLGFDTTKNPEDIKIEVQKCVVSIFIISTRPIQYNMPEFVAFVKFSTVRAIIVCQSYYS